MLGFLSAYDEEEKQAQKEKICFIHICSSCEDDIQKEVAPKALSFARHLDLEKVYLFFGERKLVYDYSDRSLQS